MKPLLRYTMGRVSQTGWHILQESIRLMKKVYPEFDIIICHNKMTPEEVLKLEEFEVELLQQDHLEAPFAFVDDDEGRVRNFCWKLVPPRLRPEAHELWVDNDIVITDRVAGIDDWLAKNTGLIGKGFFPDYGRFVDRMKHDPQPYCAGLFGLPPHYDFASVIKSICGDEPLKGFDEQGLVALAVTQIQDFVVLGQRDLVLLSECWSPKGIRWYPNALHFARANRFDNHKCWRAYKKAVTV